MKEKISHETCDYENLKRTPQELIQNLGSNFFNATAKGSKTIKIKEDEDMTGKGEEIQPGLTFILPNSKEKIMEQIFALELELEEEIDAKSREIFMASLETLKNALKNMA